jgi:hypothetical protein
MLFVLLPLTAIVVRLYALRRVRFGECFFHHKLGSGRLHRSAELGSSPSLPITTARLLAGTLSYLLQLESVEQKRLAKRSFNALHVIVNVFYVIAGACVHHGSVSCVVSSVATSSYPHTPMTA